MTGSRRWPRGWLVTGLVLLSWLTIDRPWTIRPIGAPRSSSIPFDATAWVDGVWTPRVLPHLDATAVSMEAFVATSTANGPAARSEAVRFEGVVTAVDSSSRVGVASIDLQPADGRPDAVLQIGPVVRGTALRDALDFVRFSDFTNQIEFAAIGRALNDRVLANVLAGIDPATLQGRLIRVLGVASHGAQPGDLPWVVPIRLDTEVRR